VTCWIGGGGGGSLLAGSSSSFKDGFVFQVMNNGVGAESAGRDGLVVFQRFHLKRRRPKENYPKKRKKKKGKTKWKNEST
jgi:hypothetical protein